MNDIFPMYQQHVQGFKWILETIRNRPCPNHRDEGLRPAWFSRREWQTRKLDLPTAV